jgi:hypothetical protein
MLPRTTAHYLMTGMIILAFLACDFPGLAPDPAAEFYPSHTAAVRTLEAMMTEKAGGPAGSSQSTSADTPLAQTETPAPTPTRPSKGTYFMEQGDGSSIFADYDAGYEVVAPAGWLAFRPYHEEYYALWGTDSASDPDFLAALTRYQSPNADIVRLLALDPEVDHIKGGFVNGLEIDWSRDDDSSISDGVKSLIKVYKQFNMKTISSGTGQNSSGVPIGIAEMEGSMTTYKGEKVSLHIRGIIYKLDKGLLAVILSVIREQKDNFRPGFDRMADPITFFDR